MRGHKCCLYEACPLEAHLRTAVEIIEDCWEQFAYRNGKGKAITGGLSTLEWIEAELPSLRAAVSVMAEEEK